MTYQQIIEQAETLSINEQKSLLSYLFLKYLNPEKQEFLNLFHYKNDIEKVEKNNLINTFSSWKNKLPENLVISDDEFYS